MLLPDGYSKGVLARDGKGIALVNLGPAEKASPARTFILWSHRSKQRRHVETQSSPVALSRGC